MKPKVERVTIPSGCSIRVYHRRIPDIPFEWHHHPEYELTLTLNSRGMRFIGDHIGSYQSNDLVLIPSDMPHTWASKEAIDPSAPHQAIVIWFTERWARQIADLCPEYVAINQLLNRSAGALSFDTVEADSMLRRKHDLLSQSPSARLHAALSLLAELGGIEGIPLVATPKTKRATDDDMAQLDRVLEYLQKNYADPIRIEQLCEVGNMSARTLHRFFVNHIGGNVTDYLKKLRIGHACMLLVETNLSVSVIAARAGFFSMSNFNRSFLETRQMKPLEFRKFVQQQGRLPKLFMSDLQEKERSFILQRDKARQIDSEE
jgi:AraC-like DNA-binding protein